MKAFVVTPRSLLVPTAVSQTGPPSSAGGAFLDHFTCYDVRISNGTPRAGATATVQTSLETASMVLQRPQRLCVPTDKNNEDPTAPSFPDSLLCYKVKNSGSVGGTVFLNNQFGQQVYRLRARQQVCVPTLVNPPSTTTTTTSTTSTTTSTTETSTTTTTSTTMGGSPSGAFL